MSYCSTRINIVSYFIFRDLQALETISFLSVIPVFITCDSLLYVAVLNSNDPSRFRSFIHSSDLSSITCQSLKVLLIYFRFTLYFLVVFPLILPFRSSQPYIKKYLSTAHYFQIIRQTVYFYLSRPSYYFKYSPSDALKNKTYPHTL